MKRINDFSKNELLSSNLQYFYGGTEIYTSNSDSSVCDVVYDDNENGSLDPGECVDFIECK